MTDKKHGRKNSAVLSVRVSLDAKKRLIESCRDAGITVSEFIEKIAGNSTGLKGQIRRVYTGQ